MDAALCEALLSCETDLDGVMKRFSNDEALYAECLKEFLKDASMAKLDEALANQAWDEAFTAAHALKGLTGNMGFVPLFHATAELVVLIRAGRVQEVDASYQKVRRAYDMLASALMESGGIISE